MSDSDNDLAFGLDPAPSPGPVDPGCRQSSPTPMAIRLSIHNGLPFSPTLMPPGDGVENSLLYYFDKDCS